MVAVKKITDKAVKVDSNFTVNMYDNGYMLEIYGDNKKNDGVTVRILANTLEELLVLVKEACEMDRR
jgi:hypothetical protein